MIEDKYEELRAAAQKATPGPWLAFVGKNTFSVCLPDRFGKLPCIVNWPGFDGTDLPVRQNRANAKYMAAANPETVRELLAERDELKREIEIMRGER